MSKFYPQPSDWLFFDKNSGDIIACRKEFEEQVRNLQKCKRTAVLTKGHEFLIITIQKEIKYVAYVLQKFSDVIEH